MHSSAPVGRGDTVQRTRSLPRQPEPRRRPVLAATPAPGGCMHGSNGQAHAHGPARAPQQRSGLRMHVPRLKFEN